jgi:hypothetical protein
MDLFMNVKFDETSFISESLHKTNAFFTRVVQHEIGIGHQKILTLEHSAGGPWCLRCSNDGRAQFFVLGVGIPGASTTPMKRPSAGPATDSGWSNWNSSRVSISCATSP